VVVVGANVVVVGATVVVVDAAVVVGDAVVVVAATVVVVVVVVVVDAIPIPPESSPQAASTSTIATATAVCLFMATFRPLARNPTSGPTEILRMNPDRGSWTRSSRSAAFAHGRSGALCKYERRVLGERVRSWEPESPTWRSRGRATPTPSD